MRQVWQEKLTERFVGTRNHMDENHQDKTESKQTATEDKLSLPPLLFKDHKDPDHPENNRIGAIIKLSLIHI